jgi:hypothetical protein
MFGDGGFTLCQAHQIQAVVAAITDSGDTLAGTQIDGLFQIKGPAVGVGVADPAAVEQQIQDAVAIQIDKGHGLHAFLGHLDRVPPLPDWPAAAIDVTRVAEELNATLAPFTEGEIRTPVAGEIAEVGIHVRA